jgi:hypothetical protein
MRKPIGLLVLVLFCACATANKDDKPKPRAAREVVSGGASIRGGGVRMDVQVGRPFAQKPTKSGATAAKPAAVVTP